MCHAVAVEHLRLHIVCVTAEVASAHEGLSLRDGYHTSNSHMVEKLEHALWQAEAGHVGVVLRLVEAIALAHSQHLTCSYHC